jgi:ABC-type phosphate transport system, periplasmic component
MLVLTTILGMGLTSNAANSQIKIMLDGKELVSDQAPRLESNYTLVPIRVIAENLGGYVGYDGTTKQVTIETADHKISLTVNSKTATVDGKSVSMDIPMRNLGNRTFVPLRFISENLGADVNYIGSTRTVTVNYFSKMSGTLKIDGSTTIQPIADAAAKALMNMNSGKLTVTVTGGGSGVGVKDAAAGAVNIGNSSAALTAAQKAQYPDLVQTQIGSDAIAVIVNKSNPVKNLSKQQVFDIFTGKIVNWKAVGGNDAPILVQVRESTSGTASSFFDLAIKPIDSKAIIPTGFTPNISSGALMQAVNANPNAIGYDSYGFIDPAKTKAISIEDIECTDNNVNALVWPYTRSLVMLTKNNPTGLSAMFINYVRSLEGQKILSSMDYILLRNKFAKQVGK